MARRTDLRPIVKPRSTGGTGYTYVTRKNRRNNPDRLVLRKFDPVPHRYVDETRRRLVERRDADGARLFREER